MIDIPNYNGKYLISKEGDIYSVPKKRNLKPNKSVRGYMVVNVNTKIRPVHQLVCEAYIDSDYKQKGLVVDHINRDKLDNRLSNLRLVDKSVNHKNSDYYESRKKGCIFKRTNGNYRAIITINGSKSDKTFRNLVDAESFIKLKNNE